MRTSFLNSLLAFFKYIFTRFSKLLCFVKKRKLSTHEQCIPMTIKVDAQKNGSEVQLVDWNTWGEEEKQSEREENDVEITREELFRDMEPVINRAKVVHVKKKIKAPPTDPFAFQSKNTGSYSKQRTLSNSFNPQYQVNSELGVWEDEPSGWDDEIDDREISMETANMLKVNKQLERERRTQEQQRKKLEREQSRAVKKHESHIAVKIS